MNRSYIAIDLKSFYASVECMDRGLDPLKAKLVVADESRTEKTICLAVSPALKKYGIPGRPRLFEVVRKTREIQRMTGEKIEYIVAPPRMGRYVEVSTQIFDIYLKYVAKEDIHVYSVDEVFMDVTNYLATYKMTAREFAMHIIKDVLKQTGITATAGVGTNLYLCKVAMDIGAKHVQPDENGVRICELDERTYRETLWSHKPLTDFWRVGRGTAKKLEENGMFTMGDVARKSTYNEELLYKLFGINAELLIDHAWGYEPCTIADIRAYKPSENSISSGQVLKEPYTFEKARLVVREMADALSLDLVRKRLVTDSVELTVGYDRICLEIPELSSRYKGSVEEDRYGRRLPKAAHGTQDLGRQTSSTKLITKAVTEIFDRTVNKELFVRRMYVVANHVVKEETVSKGEDVEQLSFFVDFEAEDKKREEESREFERERRAQEAILSIKKRYGKNAILKGMNLEDGATGAERNSSIGGHKA